MLKTFFTTQPIRDKEVSDSLSMIDARISHLEDSIMDYREVLIKLVKQGNTIVQFLKDLDASLMGDVRGFPGAGKVDIEVISQDEKEQVKQQFYLDFIKDFNKKIKKLTDLEKELEKYKDQITPGQVGDA